MKKIAENAESDERLRALLETASGTPDPARLERIRATVLARISHGPSAAEPACAATPALRSVRVLNVPSSTFPRPNRRAPCIHGTFRPLAANHHEKSGLARIPEKDPRPRFTWFPSLLGAGALAGLLLVLSLWNAGTQGRKAALPLEHIGSVASDDVQLTELVDLLAAFTEGDGDGGGASADRDVLGLDPLAWKTIGEDDSTLL